MHLTFQAETTTPQETRVETSGPCVDLHYSLQMQAKTLLDMVDGIPLLMDHLEANFNWSLGKMKHLAADITSEILHLERTNLVFQAVEDGLGMRLAHLKDMLKQGTRPQAVRRL